jgi:hypothetical protein
MWKSGYGEDVLVFLQHVPPNYGHVLDLSQRRRQPGLPHVREMASSASSWIQFKSHDPFYAPTRFTAFFVGMESVKPDLQLCNQR